MCRRAGRGWIAQTIAGFAGRPYAEVAVEVIRPFVGDAIAEHDLARMAREAYGNFRHPAVAPLMQYGANEFLLELFHGPTLAFKDLAMQLLGPAHGPRAGGARRAHHDRGRDLGRHRRRCGRGVSRLAPAPTSSCCSRTAASPTCSGG